MSTLMSTDMNLSRSSTRIHRPPGGATTISFGDYDSAAPKEIKESANPVPTISAVEVSEVDQTLAESVSTMEISTSKPLIGLAVAGAGSESIISAISKALDLEGGFDCTVTRVDDPSILPYVTQELIKTCDIVIASSLLSASTQSIGNAIVASLYEVGVRSGKPVIPGIISSTSLLEAKALVPIYSATWIKSVTTIVNMKKNEKVYSEPLPSAPLKLSAQYTSEVIDIDILMDSLRQTLKEHGARGIHGIARKFRIADDNGNGLLEFSEFAKVVKEHTLQWTATQVRAVFDFFDKDKSNSISYNEFLVGVRGSMNERRRQLVLLAFEIFDSDKSGVIELDDLVGKYDAKKHPDVISGRRSESEVLSEFLDTFDSIDKDGKVHPSEFIHYYNMVSASIDDDDYFELMIRNAWHISGGEGWCANSTCRRVLVSHSDGRQTVEEIKNDLGIGATDREAIIANLAGQGITDVAGIDTTGNCGSNTSLSAPANASSETLPPVPPETPSKGDAQAAAGGRSNNHKFSEQNARATAPSTSFNPRRQPGGASSIVFG